MIEYLNRETVLKELDRNSITKKITLSDGVSIYDSIQKLPAADVVKVVRCKDCKHWVSPMKDDAHYCFQKFGLVGIVAEEDFCSYGERKEQ